MATPVSKNNWLNCLSCWWSPSMCRGNANLSGLMHSRAKGMSQFGTRTSHSCHSAPLCSIACFESARTRCALWGRWDGEWAEGIQVDLVLLSLKDLAYAHIRIKQYRMMWSAVGRRQLVRLGGLKFWWLAIHTKTYKIRYRVTDICFGLILVRVMVRPLVPYFFSNSNWNILSIENFVWEGNFLTQTV